MMEDLAANLSSEMTDTRAVLGAVETHEKRWDKQEKLRVSSRLVAYCFRNSVSLAPRSMRGVMPAQSCCRVRKGDLAVRVVAFKLRLNSDQWWCVAMWHDSSCIPGGSRHLEN